MDIERPKLFDVTQSGDEIEMRAPCKNCGAGHGVLLPNRGGQDVVRCAECDAFAYNAPRSETGRPSRSLRTRRDISPRQRARIMERAGGSCELCHNPDRPLHVGHLLSVDEGHAQGVADAALWSDQNLAAICAEENIGQGRDSVTLLLFAALLRARELRAAGRDAA